MATPRHPSGVTAKHLINACVALNDFRSGLLVGKDYKRAMYELVDAAIDEAAGHAQLGCGGYGPDVDCPLCEAVKNLAYQATR